MNIDGIIEAAIAVGKAYTDRLNAHKKDDDDSDPIRLELRCIGSRLHWDNVIFAVFYATQEGNYYYFQCDPNEDMTVDNNWNFVFQRSSFHPTEFDEIIWSLPN